MSWSPCFCLWGPHVGLRQKDMTRHDHMLIHTLPPRTPHTHRLPSIPSHASSVSYASASAALCLSSWQSLETEPRGRLVRPLCLDVSMSPCDSYVPAPPWVVVDVVYGLVSRRAVSFHVLRYRDKDACRRDKRLPSSHLFFGLRGSGGK